MAKRRTGGHSAMVTVSGVNRASKHIASHRASHRAAARLEALMRMANHGAYHIIARKSRRERWSRLFLSSIDMATSSVV